MLNKIKSLFNKKESGTWRTLNTKEKDALIEDMASRIMDLEENNNLLINEIGEMPSYCDKCDITKNSHKCIKCNGTGIVKKKLLMGWPWQ